MWWDSSNVQRCMHTYRPSTASDTSPVIIQSSGYGTCGLGPISLDWMRKADRYGFFAVDICSLETDGAGNFGLQFGGDWIATTSNPVSCDSRDMDYLTSVFNYIETSMSSQGSIYLYGFSQNSMFALYTTACFTSKVSGIFQGGSGLARQGYTPVVPGFQGFCSETSYMEHGSDCCAEAWCSACEYWPVYPNFGADKVIDCIMSYTNDQIACGSDYYAYEAMIANGHDARLLSFPPGVSGGGHSAPLNSVDWIVGCLGVTTSCSSTCETSFLACTGSGNSYTDCIDDATQLSGCTTSCAPTLNMLLQSESAVVSLSEGKFGTQTGLTVAPNPAPEPNCDFGNFSEGIGFFGMSGGCTYGTPEVFPTTTTVSPSDTTPNNSSDNDTALIAVGVGVGVLAAIFVLGALWVCCCKAKVISKK